MCTCVQAQHPIIVHVSSSVMDNDGRACHPSTGWWKVSGTWPQGGQCTPLQHRLLRCAMHNMTMHGRRNMYMSSHAVACHPSTGWWKVSGTWPQGGQCTPPQHRLLRCAMHNMTMHNRETCICHPMQEHSPATPPVTYTVTSKRRVSIEIKEQWTALPCRCGSSSGEPGWHRPPRHPYTPPCQYAGPLLPMQV